MKIPGRPWRIRKQRYVRHKDTGTRSSSSPRCSSCPSSIWSDTWLWEILATIVSGLCFILSLLLLRIYNQNPVPQFSYSITLNTIISTLTTFSKSSLIVAVAGSISQLKWRWYHNSTRSIFDTQLFDDASRGPWGSIMILAKAQTWSLVSIGALVSILALAFDPFTQQVILYPTRAEITSDPAGRPSNISRARAFVAGDPDIALYNVQQIVTGALWDLSEDHDGVPIAHCPTGNCTWDEFESLALCSSCQNRTMDLGISGCSLSWNTSEVQQVINSAFSEDSFSILKNCSIDFPANFLCDVPSDFSILGEVQRRKFQQSWYASDLYYPGHIFEASIALGSLNGFTNGSDKPSFFFGEDGETPGPWNLLRFCDVEVARDRTHNIGSLFIKQATTCQLTPCVKKHAFSIANGTSKLKTLEDRYGSWYTNATGLYFADGKLYYVETGQPLDRVLEPSWSDAPGENGRILNLSNVYSPFNFSSTPYTISADDIFPLLQITNMLAGQITIRDAFADDEKNLVSNSTGIQFKEQFFRRQTLSSPFLSAELLDFQQIANRGGLTWAIPQIANKLNKFLRDSGGIPVAGTSYAIVAIVDVRWQWLSLPIVTWILGTGFFMMTVWVCRGDQLLWKTSSLPLIYHGFGARDIEAIDTTSTHIERLSGMESLAVNLHARFRKDSVDGQLRLSKS